MTTQDLKSPRFAEIYPFFVEGKFIGYSFSRDEWQPKRKV